jgi:hypothetical protein
VLHERGRWSCSGWLQSKRDSWLRASVHARPGSIYGSSATTVIGAQDFAADSESESVFSCCFAISVTACLDMVNSTSPHWQIMDIYFFGRCFQNLLSNGSFMCFFSCRAFVLSELFWLFACYFKQSFFVFHGSFD